MPSRRTLERRLASLAGFAEPRAALEQYPTPPEIAAHLLHVAALQGDLSGTVVDLGTGTGVLALGAALQGASRVVGLERDSGALRSARENERVLYAGDDRGAPAVEWLLGDVRRVPLRVDADRRNDVTVVMNPPFGAQDGSSHADRPFLATAADLASVSYSIHNAGSRAFVEAFAAEHGGTVTHAFAVDLDLDRQFDFHERERTTVDAEAYRIEWESG